MGISGLLPLLKSIHKPCHVKKFAGQTLGIDAYGWLHRGTTACAVQLALGQPTTKYVDFAMSRVRMLLHFGIIPYLVFDGDYLPSKAGTEKDRLARREESKKLGLELLRLGKSSQAHIELQKAVDVTPDMAALFIHELKKANVKYLVAPYEADSQLAYLEKQGFIQGVISEDSDLLVFGVSCLITKLDQYGECIMIRRNDFTACREISLVGWTDADFRKMAILSGCDYLQNISKVGLKTAHRMLRKHKTVQRVLQAMRLEGKVKVPPDYFDNFVKAEMTFLYQWVFCPNLNSLVNLTQPDDAVLVRHMPYIGAFVDPHTAAAVARGDLNPHTKQPIVLPGIPPRLAPTKAPPYNPRPNQVCAQENPIGSKGVTLDSFFKRRVPLAELDVNSFIMTDRQQQLARNASTTSWAPRVAPQASSVRNNNANGPPMTPPAASGVTPRDEQPPAPPAPPARALDTSATRSLKRQRLCQDESLILGSASIGDVMSGRSKFFSKPTKSKKKRGADFTVFSDDSIEEAMLKIPDPLPRAQIPATVTQDPDHTSAEVCQPEDTLAKLAEVDDVDESQYTLIPESPIPPFDSEETFVDTDPSPSTAKQGVFDAYLLSDIKAMRRTSGQAPSEAAAVPRTPRKTIAATIIPCTPDVADATAVAGTGHVLVPASAQVAKHGQVPCSPKAVGFGSEDLLVSESEAEDDEPVPKLDLTRFAFTAGR